jgi:hypothetical protein
MDENVSDLIRRALCTTEAVAAIDWYGNPDQAEVDRLTVISSP